MAETPALIAVAALLLALALLGAKRWRRRRRCARGAEAEREALWLARAAGYRVLDTQVAGAATIVVDGERIEAPLRADLLLARGGRRYIGEVKSGRRAPDPRGRDTRRQLLEYSLAFDVDGLLLFDMSAGAIRRVEFPRRARRGWLWPMLVGLGAGLALGLTSPAELVARLLP